MNDILLKQIKAIVDPSLPLVSNLSNAASVLFKMENLNWAGFYIVKDNSLYLGPFQGDVACTIIPFGKGVCGTAWEKKETIIVDDVNKFPGHIACSSLSKSEIVVPIFVDNEVVAVIDLDAPIYNRFNSGDKAFLEDVSKILSEAFKNSK